MESLCIVARLGVPAAGAPSGPWGLHRVPRPRPAPDGGVVRSTPVLRALATSLGAAAATWWLVGDRSEPSLVPGDLSYSLVLPDLPPVVTATAGGLGLLVVVVLGWPLVRDRRSRRPAVALLAVGVALGVGLRIETGGVHGANIGGGMVLLAAPAVAGVAVAQARRLHRATGRVAPDGPPHPEAAA